MHFQEDEFVTSFNTRTGSALSNTETTENHLALFDFDGTISSKDSLWDLIFFAVGWRKFGLGVIYLLPVLLKFKFGLLCNHKAKQAVIGHFFKGWQIADFDTVGIRYADEKLPDIIKDSAIKRIQWHKRQGHTIVVVSASLENWLGPWCQQQGLNLIATRLQVRNKVVTGMFDGPNCSGSEKVRRIKEMYDLQRFCFIYAYGDSKGDKEMLTLATKQYYRYFL